MCRQVTIGASSKAISTSTGKVPSLFANYCGVEFLCDAVHYTNPAGLTQPEINRIVHTLRKIQYGESSNSPAGTSS